MEEFKPMIDISADVLLTIVNFLILLVVLYKILYKPVTAMLARREAEISNAVSGASAERDAALQMKSEYEQLLANARGEAQQIMNRAHQQSASIIQEAHQKADAEAQQVLSRARQEIDTEHQQMLLQLKGEIAGLAILAAEKLMAQKMDNEANRRLVNEFIQSKGDD